MCFGKKYYEQINPITNEKEWAIDEKMSFKELVKTIYNIRKEEKHKNIEYRIIIIKDEINNVVNKNFKDKIEIGNCIFEKEIYFENSKFYNKVKIYNCEFKSNFRMINVIFEDLVDFYGCVFNTPQQFYKIDFKQVAIFAHTTFKKETQFIYCKTTSSSYISFQSAKFERGIDLARANFNCKMSFWDMKVDDKGLLRAIKSKYYLLDFEFTWLKDKIKKLIKKEQLTEDKIYEIIQKESNKDIEDVLQEIENTYGSSIRISISIKQEIDKLTPASKKLRESMRFIKNNFYAENNKIEGLEFYKKEMGLYRKEIEKGSLQDRIILWFNRWSNNFETSWIRGILFTIIWGIITVSSVFISFHFTETELGFSWEDWTNTLKTFVEIINITKWTDIKLFDTEPLNGLRILILFLGRIFIGYGYYQTIQAFRKYGKS